VIGYAAVEADQEVQPIEGVPPQDDLAVDHLETAVHPEPLLDRPEDQRIGPFG